MQDLSFTANLLKSMKEEEVQHNAALSKKVIPFFFFCHLWSGTIQIIIFSFKTC